MNTRLKEIRLINKMSQEEFGKRIGIESRGHISTLESGTRSITDRIVKDVCREFNVSEEWLRNGTEPMYKEIDDKLSTYLAEIAISNDDFIKDLITVYMELDDTSRQALKKLADGMAAEREKREQN